MMDGACCWPGRRGSRCHSSSVTKGMKGCSRRSPVSRHTHSVSRVACLAAAAPGAAGREGGGRLVPWLLTLGLFEGALKTGCWDGRGGQAQCSFIALPQHPALLIDRHVSEVQQQCAPASSCQMTGLTSSMNTSHSSYCQKE